MVRRKPRAVTNQHMAEGVREIASLVGLAPLTRDSRLERGQRHICAGRPGPRTALYLAAMNGARFDPVLKAMYERMIEAGKPPMVVLFALARKLLTILNAMDHDGRGWEQMTAWKTDRITVACRVARRSTADLRQAFGK